MNPHFLTPGTYTHERRRFLPVLFQQFLLYPIISVPPRAPALTCNPELCVTLARITRYRSVSYRPQTTSTQSSRYWTKPRLARTRLDRAYSRIRCLSAPIFPGVSGRLNATWKVSLRTLSRIRTRSNVVAEDTWLDSIVSRWSNPMRSSLNTHCSPRRLARACTGTNTTTLVARR